MNTEMYPLEYACELWDGCCSRDADKLEQLQFEAPRIITGLPKFASKEYLYEFHERIVDGKNDLENVSKRHLGTLYCKEFLRYNC
jgi:hypothetical protein